MDNRVEYLIKGGHVIDTASGIDRVADVAFSRGKIVGIDIECTPQNTIDAKGMYVFPGLIDFHVHAADNTSAISVKPDLMIPMGVTAVVDAGSVGYANFGAFLHTVNNSTVRVKCQLSPFSAGQIDEKLVEDYTKERIFDERIIDTCEKYKDIIIGLKLRISCDVVHELGLSPVEHSLEILKNLPGRHLCVHSTDVPNSMTALCDMMRKDDIVTHCYNGKGNTIIDENDRVYDGVKNARARGVLFDMAHGHVNFSNITAKKAMADGFYPDVISSDMTLNKLGMSNIVRSLPMMMSKFLAFGMPLYDVVCAVTEKPAQAM